MPGGIMCQRKRDEYYPITFIEPFRGYRAHFGYDLGSNTVYGAALREAMATGRPVAAVSPRLDRGGTVGNRLVVVEPAWNEHPKAVKRPLDRAEINGFVLGVFHIGAIVQEAMDIFHPLGIDLYIYDSSGADDRTLIAVRLSSLHGRDANLAPSPAEARPPETSVHFLTTINVANRRWTVDCVPMDLYFTGQKTREPEGALLAGLLVTGWLAGYLVLSSGRSARVERRVAEQTRELRESEERFRRLVDNAGDGFFLRDEQWRIRDVNKRACDSLGYTREELLSMTIADVDTEFTLKNLARYTKLSDDAYPVSFEGTHRRKDGTTFPVEVRLTSVDVGGERMMLSLVRDITDRKRSEVALRNEQRLLRELLGLQERDRQLVAYEIHDGLAQQLTGALYKFQSIESARTRDPEAARQMFDEGVRLLRDAMTECRRLISGLRPPVLDEAGIVAAIDALVAEQRQRGGPQIEFVHRVEFDRLAPPVETAAFRIVQECLTNACRYSQSEKVLVGLWQVNGRVHIDVQDFGIGFDPERVQSGHFGLQGVRERARLFGGVAIIRAAPQRGTHITVELPLLPPAENKPAGEGG